MCDDASSLSKLQATSTVPSLGGVQVATGIGCPATGGSSSTLPSLGGVQVATCIGCPATGGRSSLPSLGARTMVRGGNSWLPAIGRDIPAGTNSRLPALHVQALGSTCSLVQNSFGRAGFKRKAPRQGLEEGTGEDTSAWRTTAYEDLPAIGRMYGMDLVQCPPEWLNEKSASEYLKIRDVRVPQHDGTSVSFRGVWGFWELFSGCSHATEAYISPATGGGVAGPPIDKVRSPWRGLPTFDVLQVECRRLLWSLLVVFSPMWVHTGPPCTMWSTLSRRNNKRTATEEEHLRLEALVFLIFSVQVCQYQKSQNRHCSFEQPARAASWNLDFVQDMLNGNAVPMMPATGGRQVPSTSMRLFHFDSCCWGHVDPGNGMFYKKSQRFASNADMSSLCFKCRGGHAHQVVEGNVSGGPRHGARRSVVAGEYPMEFCVAWAKVIKTCRPLAA